SSVQQDEEAQIKASLDKLSPEDRKLAEEQQFCAVRNDNRLGSMGTPVKLMVKDQPVFLCCKGCTSKAQNSPEETLAKAEELKAKAPGRLVGNADDAPTMVTTVAVPESGKPAVARVDGEGTIHLLYNSADGPKYVKSSNNGGTLEPPIAVVDEGSRKPGLEF